jgi:hypothetical protein
MPVPCSTLQPGIVHSHCSLVRNARSRPDNFDVEIEIQIATIRALNRWFGLQRFLCVRSFFALWP